MLSPSKRSVSEIEHKNHFSKFVFFKKLSNKFRKQNFLVDSNGEKISKFILVLTFVFSLSGFMFGYDTGYISSTLVIIKDDLSNKFLTPRDKELITSATSFGAIFGVIFAGTFTNLFGRIKFLYVSNGLLILGTILQLISKTILTMTIGRCVLGLGVGIASFIAPLLLIELSPSKFRGRLVVTNVLFITGGQLISYIITWKLTDHIYGWRISVFICLIPAVIQMSLLPFLYDSSRYYVINSNIHKATKSLEKIYDTLNFEFINSTIEEIQKSNSQNSNHSILKQTLNSFKEIYSNRTNLNGLMMACSLQAIQQFTGFNSLMYFSSTVFQLLGFKNSTAVSIIISATNFFFTVVALFLIDKVGRKKILLFSLSFMSIAMIISAFAFYSVKLNFEINSVQSVKNLDNKKIGLILFGIFLFVSSYAIGIGNSAWTAPELFSDANVRSIGSMHSTAVNWIGSLVIASTFLTMLQKLTPTITFGIFGLLCMISFLFIKMFYTDLTGLKLESTTYMYNNKEKN